MRLTTGRLSASSFASNVGKNSPAMTSRILPNCAPYADHSANPACFVNDSSAVACTQNMTSVTYSNCPYENKKKLTENRFGGTLFTRRLAHAHAWLIPCGCRLLSHCVYAP